MKKLMLMVVGACAPLWTGTAATIEAGYWDPLERSTKEVDVGTVSASTRLLGAGWYAVDGKITIDGTLALEGDANLILADDATLTVTGGIAGEGHNLTVWGQEKQTGWLIVNGTNGVSGANAVLPEEGFTVTGGVGGAGGTAIVCAGLTVKGGTVRATGGTGGRGGALDLQGNFPLAVINGGSGGEGGCAVRGSVSFVYGRLVATGGSGGEGGKGIGERPFVALDGGTSSIKGKDGAKGADGKAFDRQPTVDGDELYIAAGASSATCAICPNTDGWEGWAFADFGSAVPKETEAVNYVDASGAPCPAVSCTLLPGGGFDRLEEGWYAVSGEGATYAAGLELAGDVNLILVDGTKLIVNGGITGAGHNLTVWGQKNQSGALIVNGLDGCEGAVGEDGQGFASVWDQGGSVTDFEKERDGGNGGDGSIGGNAIVCVTLTINGGAVSVKGGNGGSGGSGGNGGSANVGFSIGVGFKGGAGGAGGQGGAGAVAISCENCNLAGGILLATAGQGGRGGQGGCGGDGGDGARGAVSFDYYKPNGGDGGAGGKGGAGGEGVTAIIGVVTVSGGVLAGVGGDAGLAGYGGGGGAGGKGGAIQWQKQVEHPQPDDYETIRGDDGVAGRNGAKGAGGTAGKAFATAPEIEMYEKVTAEDAAWDGSTALTTYKKVVVVASLPEQGTTVWNPWRIGATVENSVTAYVSDGELIVSGSGAMKDFTLANPAPWTASASSVTAVTVATGVTKIGKNAFVSIGDAVPVNGYPSSFFRMMGEAYGQFSPANVVGGIAANPATVEVVDGKVKIGVSVRQTDDISAKPEDWSNADFSNVEVKHTDDGDRVILTIPVTAAQGFFQIRTGAE